MRFSLASANKPILLAVVVCLLAASIVSICLSMCEPQKKPDLTKVIKVAEALAEETARILDNNQGKVVIFAFDGESYRAEIQAFENRLKQKGCAAPVTVETVSTEEMRKNTRGGIPGAYFLK